MIQVEESGEGWIGCDHTKGAQSETGFLKGQQGTLGQTSSREKPCQEDLEGRERGKDVGNGAIVAHVTRKSRRKVAQI